MHDLSLYVRRGTRKLRELVFNSFDLHNKIYSKQTKLVYIYKKKNNNNRAMLLFDQRNTSQPALNIHFIFIITI